MATTTATKRKQQQRQATIQLVFIAGIIVLLNILASLFHYGFDLTKEKRFSLSPATKNMLRNLKDVAVIDVYLKGDFPAGFQHLSDATKECLQSFREYGGSHIIFRFTDPIKGKSQEEKMQVYQDFAKRGINPVNLRQQSRDAGYSEKVIFPDAVVHYNGRELPVNLLDNHTGLSNGQVFSHSQSVMEYKFANAIHKLSLPDLPHIAYVMGNGESLGLNTIDALTTLQNTYHLDTIDLAHIRQIPIAYDAIIFNKPTTPFSDPQKFAIDQYVMHGGHILWFVDMMHTPMDSLNHSEAFLSMDYGLNLDDILFKYGVRINADLIEDMHCALLPVMGQRGMEKRPWIYFPLFQPTGTHPIIKNMDEVFSKFASSIDTIANRDIKKTILLQSSQYSRTANAPVRVSLSMMQYDLRPDMFKNPYRNAAVLLEGKFSSVFQNRLPVTTMHFLDSIHQPFKLKCDTANSMIVVSDGDLISNDFTSKAGPMEMGYWQYTGEYFSNKSFMLNCMEYLTDHSGLLEARSKDLRIRQLDAGRVEDEKTKWQLINIGLPIVLVLVFASCYIFFRKRRYERSA
ncbi:MAG: gliding motility-associated ABC transporter substrate-binding protein GldG [Taibaiella sp.]|nr:gliding motility-associated ABC transporter substrate-binding protein GldG [Taibaiella sp.]